MQMGRRNTVRTEKNNLWNKSTRNTCMAAGPSACSLTFSALFATNSALSQASAILKRGEGSPFALSCLYKSNSPIFPCDKSVVIIGYFSNLLVKICSKYLRPVYDERSAIESKG